MLNLASEPCGVFRTRGKSLVQRKCVVLQVKFLVRLVAYVAQDNSLDVYSVFCKHFLFILINFRPFVRDGIVIKSAVKLKVFLKTPCLNSLRKTEDFEES